MADPGFPRVEGPVVEVLPAIIAGSLESAYSLIRGCHEIWGQSLGTFMISRPIYQGSDWWKFFGIVYQ